MRLGHFLNWPLRLVHFLNWPLPANLLLSQLLSVGQVVLAYLLKTAFEGRSLHFEFGLKLALIDILIESHWTGLLPFIEHAVAKQLLPHTVQKFDAGFVVALGVSLAARCNLLRLVNCPHSNDIITGN